MSAGLPLVVPVRQAITRAPLADPGSAVHAALGPLLTNHIPAHALVGITVGSRGIHGYVAILRAVGQAVGAAGGRPICIPAMGSHGGGTAAGRRAHLARLGITEAAIGYPVVDGDPVELGKTGAGVPVYAASPATRCAGVVIVNRVKPHSNLVAPLGSGLRKMLAVGLGGAAGAEALHAAGLGANLVAAAQLAAQKLEVLAGLAILEDGAGDCTRIVAVAAADLDRVEPELLAAAEAALPRLPIKALDALVVRQMGKDVSGVGMDPNVIGRARRLGTPEGPDDVMRIGRIAACALTPATGGNALGIGMADIVTERLRAAMDAEVTGVNARTAGFTHGDRVGTVVATDRDAVEAACAGHAPEAVRLAVIADTSRLETFLVSTALVLDIAKAGGCKVEGPPRPLAFDAAGALTEP